MQFWIISTRVEGWQTSEPRVSNDCRYDWVNYCAINKLPNPWKITYMIYRAMEKILILVCYKEKQNYEGAPWVSKNFKRVTNFG